MTNGTTATANRYRPAWVRHLAVKIFPDRFEHRNVANFSGSADIVTASEHGVTLPRECISQAGGRASVDLASRDAEGNLIRERREVQLGLASHLRAVIRSGIRAGDAVACP